MSIAYYNGDFCEYSDIRIPLSDRSIFFGDGIYDAAIGRCGGIFLEKEHFARFFGNARRLNLPLSFDEKILKKILSDLISKSGLSEYFLYFQLTRRAPKRAHSALSSESSSLLVTIKEHRANSSRPLRLITAEDIRYYMCDIKTLNLLPAVIVSTDAERCGCDEAVFIRDGIVTECAHSNIFIVKNGVLYTHPKGRLILPGITRGKILNLCDSIKIPHRETAFTKCELMTADEVIVSSTSRLCENAVEIDGIRIGNGEKRIGALLKKTLESEFYGEI